MMFLLLVILSTSHLSVLNDICQVCSLVCSWLRSSQRVTASAVVLTDRYRSALSAKRRMFDETESVPWDWQSPEVHLKIVWGVALHSLKSNCWVRSEKKSRIQSRRTPCTPRWCSFRRRCFLRKPNCLSISKPWASKGCITWLWITCSGSLQMMDVSEMGR